MKPIKTEDDYLKRMQNAKDNIVEYANAQQISPSTYMGETIELVLKLLDEEICQIEWLRQF